MGFGAAFSAAAQSAQQRRRQQMQMQMQMQPLTIKPQRLLGKRAIDDDMPTTPVLGEKRMRR
jgi:hypothetical protein